MSIAKYMQCSEEKSARVFEDLGEIIAEMEGYLKEVKQGRGEEGKGEEESGEEGELHSFLGSPR